MTEQTPNGLRDALSEFDADRARDLARQLDSEGDELKRRARALLAYADALDGEAAPRPSIERNAHRPNSARRSGAPPSNKRPLILAVLAKRPRPGWSPGEVQHALVERQLVPPETTKASISVTMRRMFLTEEIGKLPNGLYSTVEAAVGASGQEELVGTDTSGP